MNRHLLRLSLLLRLSTPFLFGATAGCIATVPDNDPVVATECHGSLNDGAPCDFAEPCRAFSDGWEGRCGSQVWTCVDGRVQYEDFTHACPPPPVASTCDSIAAPVPRPDWLVASSRATIDAIVELERGVRLELRADDGVLDVLELPAWPPVEVGDALRLEPTTHGRLLTTDDGAFVAFVTLPAYPLPTYSPADISAEAGPFTLTFERVCTGTVPHHGAQFGCPDVSVSQFAARLDAAVRAEAGERVEVEHEGAIYVLENRAVVARDHGARPSECADLWIPQIDVVVVRLKD
jgi:hypothetical protein